MYWGDPPDTQDVVRVHQVAIQYLRPRQAARKAPVQEAWGGDCQVLGFGWIEADGTHGSRSVAKEIKACTAPG